MKSPHVGTRVGSVLQENISALEGVVALRKQYRTRFCWRCQKDKLLSTGQVLGFKGASVAVNGGKMAFLCAECLVVRANRRAEQERLACKALDRNHHG